MSQSDHAFRAGAAIMRSRVRDLILSRRAELLHQASSEGNCALNPRIAELERLYGALAGLSLDPAMEG
jgi:hypothetical protein